MGGASAAAARSDLPLRLRRGINLWPWFSLTREQPPPSRDYDWPPFQPERPVPRPADLARLKTLGFDFVRIPVDPGPLLAFTGGRRLKLVREVLDAVGLARSAGLAVVVNLHPNAATHYWRPEAYASGLDAPHASDLHNVASLMAAALADLGDSGLAFEPVNEPPGACGSPAWPAQQVSLLEGVRKAAPRLTVVLTGACGSQTAGLEALRLIDLPSDLNVLFTFHFYEPYLFSHQGARWMTGEPMYRYLDRVPWPSSAGSLDEAIAAFDANLGHDAALPAAQRRPIREAAVAALKQYFLAQPGQPFIARNMHRAAAWADGHGIARHRLLLGELGAMRTRANSVTGADRARYIRDVRETAEELGFAWAFWNYFSSEMGLVGDDAGREPDAAIVAALGMTR